MNAGAHGGEMKQVVRRVGLVADGAPQVWSAEECGFAYRHSRFKEFAPGSLVLTWAEMELKPAPVEDLKRRMEEALACCDAAIAADGAAVTAYLFRGGLLNRLQRYDEALKCYEQAMLARDKKSPKS